MAIDAPFGFPAAFTQAVTLWDRDGVIATPDDRKLIRRVTDLTVKDRQEEAKAAADANWFCWPLSSVVERITPTTIRCAGLLSQLDESSVDRVGLTSRVIEVYPIAALRLWGIDTKRYKQEADDGREALAALCSRTGITTPAGLDQVPSRVLDDAVDALACALMARTVATTNGQSGPSGFTAEVLEVVRREGWIHLPPIGHRLEDLALTR